MLEGATQAAGLTQPVVIAAMRPLAPPRWVHFPLLKRWQGMAQTLSGQTPSQGPAAEVLKQRAFGYVPPPSAAGNSRVRHSASVVQPQGIEPTTRALSLPVAHG
jgi:hypothetical protein